MIDDRRIFRLEQDHCWACGIRQQGLILPSDPPDYPRPLEIHHIFRGPGRRHDRRNLSFLCRLCHDLAAGATVRIQGKALPNLRLDHILWLKHRHDQLDRRYLRDLRVKILPPVRIPPVWFQRAYKRRHLYGHRHRSIGSLLSTRLFQHDRK